MLWQSSDQQEAAVIRETGLIFAAERGDDRRLNSMTACHVDDGVHQQTEQSAAGLTM